MHNRHAKIVKTVKDSEKKRIVFTTSVLLAFVIVAFGVDTVREIGWRSARTGDASR